jgi:hypothetical protein
VDGSVVWAWPKSMGRDFEIGIEPGQPENAHYGKWWGGGYTNLYFW